jgi:serine/threonine protein phosphatase PrpC
VSFDPAAHEVSIVSPDPQVVAPVTCPQCGQMNRPGALFCVGCGKPLVATRQITASLVGERDRVRQAARSKAQVCPRLAPGERGPNWQAFGLSNVGRVRVNNEDSVLVSPLPGGGWLLIVCDGMGGAEAGEIASATSAVLVRELVENHLRQDPQPTTDHRPMLAQAVEAANTTLYQRARADLKLRGMGCTITVALVQGACMELAQVGDSRAYRLTADRKFQQLTLDHSMVEHLVRLGHVTPAEARQHPLRNQLYRAVGTDRIVEVDTFIYALQPTDRLLLCSDGLTLHCADDEIAGIVGAARSPETAAKALVTRALDYGAEDNVTVAVLMSL